jgi:uncharacterized protein GlcG (DUF336 family)
MNLELADAIITGAHEEARSQEWMPLTVVVLDAGGHVVAAKREDGSSTKRFEIAYGKAHGAVSLGVGSRTLMERAEQQPYFISSVTAAIGGSLVPVPGGLLIRDAQSKVIGAVGVSGDQSDNDEAAAIAGIRAAGLEADTK